MGTHAIIGAGNLNRWHGVFVHYDGFPDSLGMTIRTIYHTVFNRNIDDLIRAAIDDHPTGWSEFVSDWTQVPVDFSSVFTSRNKITAPIYYNASSEQAIGPYDQDSFKNTTVARFVYLIDPEERTLTAYQAVYNYLTDKMELEFMDSVHLDNQPVPSGIWERN